MHRFWEQVMQPIIDLGDPPWLNPKVKRMIEIGSERGANTEKILAYCQSTGGILFVVDPLPLFDVQMFKNQYKERLQIIRELSLPILPQIENPDVILIDGDHNWYTVYHELQCIEQLALKRGRFPFIFMHDTSWPYARRDMYYHPDTIPEAYRKPYAPNGIAEGQSDLLAQGGANEGFNNAIFEGGERNGVLTAIEDFLNQTKLGISFHRVMSNHGLGILLPKNELRDAKVEEIIRLSGM